MSKRLGSIETVRSAVWKELERAAASKDHAWRTPVLATAGGEHADARTVIVREVEPSQQLLRIFTDARSAKAAQLQAQPDGMLVMWSPALAWQLRLRVQLALHTDGLAVSSRWAKVKLTPGAQDYLSPLPPGAALGAPVQPQRDSREHFAVIEAQVTSIDWLELHAEGHRRAIFDAAGARWVQP
jgi:pyridoxamine 5'-phosphate oxidase